MKKSSAALKKGLIVLLYLSFGISLSAPTGLEERDEQKGATQATHVESVHERREVPLDSEIRTLVEYDRTRAVVMNALVEHSETMIAIRRLKPNRIIPHIKECEDPHCPLSGYMHRETRAPFEADLVKAITKVFDPKRSVPLVYSSLGSGYLYQDLVIVMKLLKQGYKNIVINLIDPLYKEPMNKDVLSAVKEFATFVKVDSESNVSIFLYENAADYLSEVKQDASLQSDILVAVDTLVDFSTRDGFSKSTIREEGHFLREHGLKAGGVLASLPGVLNPLKSAFIAVKQ